MDDDEAMIVTNGEILAAPEAEGDPSPEILPEVAFVVPPPAYFQAVAADESEPVPLAMPSASPDARAIEVLGEGLHLKLDELRTLFNREIRAESTREKVVDRLHGELQEYKHGLILGILRPVFVDLIQLHDDIGKMAATSEADPAPEVARLLDLMRGYQQGVEDILYRQGVETFVEEGDVFDPRRQRALSTVPTDDPARNKRVAARLRVGFKAGDKVIRPEMVTVYSFK